MRYKGIKGKAWEKVKEWTRKKYTDCYTCGARDIFSYNAQAGHYQPVAIVGSNNTLAWDPDFIRLQCSRCNGPGQGKQVVFRMRLIEELGEKKVSDFDKKVAKKWISPVKDWNQVVQSYQKLIDDL